MFRVLVTAYNCETYIRKCLESILSQTHRDFRCYLLDDCSTDETVREALAAISGDERVELVKADRKYYQIGNYDRVIRGDFGIDRQDVVIQVDGDDWLPDDRVFERVNQEYLASETWLTFGQFQFASGRLGFAGPMDFADVRSSVFTACALRSWKAFLWMNIDVADLYHEGWYAASAGDVFFVLPMLEMAGPNHTKFIVSTVNYIYNDANPLRDRTVDPAKQLALAAYARNKRPYGRMSAANE